MPQKEVRIINRDFWVKVIEMLQQNWALVEAGESGGVTVFFLDDAGGIFDQMPFRSYKEAERQLRFNGFQKYEEIPEASEFLYKPEPPLRESNHGRIYSSGRFWVESRE